MELQQQQQQQIVEEAKDHQQTALVGALVEQVWCPQWVLVAVLVVRLVPLRPSFTSSVVVVVVCVGFVCFTQIPECMDDLE